MKHFEDIRIMELALDRDGSLSSAEARHIAECEICAAAMEAEKALTTSLERIEERPVPDGFIARTEQLFARARARKSALTPSLLIGFTLAILTASAMLWLAMTHPAEITATAAMAVAKTVTFFKALFLVAERVPFAVEALTTTSGAALLMTAVMLAVLMKKAPAVK